MLEDHNINLNEEINKLFPEDVNKIEIGKLKEGKVIKSSDYEEIKKEKITKTSIFDNMI